MHVIACLPVASRDHRLHLFQSAREITAQLWYRAVMATTGAAARHGRPEGYPSTLSTYLVCTGANKVVDFITEVFAAQTCCKLMSEDKETVKHALVTLDGCAVMIGEASEEHPALPSFLHVYVDDVDQTYELALKQKGAESVQAPKDEVYGDRVCAVKDVAGNTWWIATNKFIPESNCGVAEQ